MNFKYLLFLFILSGCQIKINYIIQDQFTPYVSKFESVCGVPVTVSVISTDAMDPDTYGYCKNYGRNDILNVVYINSSWWAKASEMSREQLMFHELGHCVLDRRHDDTVIVIDDWQTPKSIMYSDPFGDYHMYEKNLNYYYNELCGVQI